MDAGLDLAPILGGKLVRIDALRFKQLGIFPEFYAAIDQIGALSAQAMAVGSPLTTAEKFQAHPDQVLYLLWENGANGGDNSQVIGYLKVGHKSLFVYDKDMRGCQGQVLCLLDFYVHYSKQRQGYGKQLFDNMLQMESKKSEGVALDTPSQTLLSFMSSQYGLVDPIWQNTNFVVYPSFFDQDDVARTDVPVVQGLSGINRPGTPHKPPKEACGKDGMRSSQVGDLSTEGTLVSRANQCKARKQHLLGHHNLW